ncbi:MAG: rhomboid family intramembrane serine protease [Candidatus Micrarchaeota archaeon]
MPNISTYLLAVIGIAFILQLIMPAFEDAFLFNPYKALTEPWRFVTSVFLHDTGGFSHIFFNSYALFVFGSILEQRISKRNYLLLFFAAGLLGSVLYYLTIFSPWPPLCGSPEDVVFCNALGASGAIYGILGAVAILIPDLTIFFWFFPMKIKYAAILWVIIEFLGTVGGASGVASAAHLGGLFFGLAYGWYLSRKPPEYTAHVEWTHY